MGNNSLRLVSHKNISDVTLERTDREREILSSIRDNEKDIYSYGKNAEDGGSGGFIYSSKYFIEN